MIVRIARMELQKMFYSPIAWLILFIFAIQIGVKVIQVLNGVVTGSQLGYETQALTHRLFAGNGGLLTTVQSNLYLYIPLLTMGLLSREISTGSIKLLYSSPLSNVHIVLGKFLSMMVFGLAMMMVLFGAVLLGAYSIPHFDYPLVLTGMLGLYLLICAYSAIGLLMSSLTSYQIVAAIGTFATLFVLGQVGTMWQSMEIVRDITFWLSISGRVGTFINGLITSEDVLYFILVTGLFVSFTIFRLKGIREKTSAYLSVSRYTGAFLLVALLGYLSTQPVLMKYYDATNTKYNTLTETSQEVLSKLKGKVELTTYVNIFEFTYIFGAPSAQKADMNRYARYLRFFPNMKLNYKYYYAEPGGERPLANHRRRYEGLTPEQALEKAAESYDVNPKRFKPGIAYLDEIDLEGEQNRFVTKITTEDGKTSLLRTYNDIGRLPDEAQITAAFKKVVMDLPVVGFVTGHEERSIHELGSRGYSTLTNNTTFRFSMVNNGFDFKECSLAEPIDDGINILVIADAKSAFSNDELRHLDDYIERGGNLIVAADLNRQEYMNPLVQRFGVSFLPGQVVELNQGFEMDLLTLDGTEQGRKLAYHFEALDGSRPVVTMPGAVGLSYGEIAGFTYTPLLVSDSVKGMPDTNYAALLRQINTPPRDRGVEISRGVRAVASKGDSKHSVSWNELQPTNFIDDIPDYNPEAGETLGPHTTALAISRTVEGREQKIVILGDADCLSNTELTTNRSGLISANFTFANGIFYWLSDGEVPIDMRRPTPPDDEITLKKSDMPLVRTLYRIVIPALILIGFVLLWFRRKGR